MRDRRTPAPVSPRTAAPPRKWCRALAVAAAATAALAPVAAPAAAAEWRLGASGPATIEVQVRERPAEELWQVSYVLPERAAGVEFARDGRAFRQRGWGVAPEATWHATETRERICFARPTRAFAATFRADYEKPEKDYEPNIAFSDGGRLLYTGNLLVKPLATCAAGDSPEAAQAVAAEIRHHFRLETDPGRSVLVGELAASERIEWEPAPGREETFVYFGNGQVDVAERAVFLLDPGLPAWLAADLRALLPRLFDRFAGETGVALPARPLVIVAFSGTGGSGTSFSGGVLNDLVAIALSGEGWAEPSQATRREWFVRLAHEAFHLWDGSTLRPDAESEWLSEAAAEAFALRAAATLDVLSWDAYQQAVTNTANRCLVELGSASLLAAPAGGSHASWYSCGATLLFVADRAVERARPGHGGLALLFREMFAEARQHGDVYGTGVFLGWLDKLTGDRPLTLALQQVIRRGVASGLDRYLDALLRGAGLPVSLVSPEEAAPEPALFRPMLRSALVRCACGTAAPESSADPDCARFAPGSALRTVDGVAVREAPADAYARLRTAVLLARPLRVVAGDDATPVELLCPRDSLDGGAEKLLKLQPPAPARR
jgi:hypothetical protein